MNDIRTTYTVRLTETQKRKLQAKSERLKMTVANTIEYLIDKDSKQSDYFDYERIETKINNILDIVSKGKK